ncbi:MAG TPA: cation:dicarboxylase symporter family transporter [Gemmatimonadota bacterium]|nr:cation:dicarboxylase symporter family transporter [Gemmatimonadota bacterium]
MDLSIERFRFGRVLTITTLAALAAGVVAGTVVPGTVEGPLRWGSRTLEAVGVAWVRGLRMTVLPLVAGLVVVAVLETSGRAGLARMGGAAAGIFFAIYAAIGAVTTLLFPPLVRALGIDRGALSSLPVEAPIQAPSMTGEMDVAEWLLHAIPTNPFAAAAEENLLQIVVFAALFAVAAGRLAPAARTTVAALFSPLAEASLVLVAWLLKASPVAVFALAYGAAREIGFGAAWVLVSFAVVTTVVMVILTLGFIPLAGVVGRVGTVRFARAAWPGQLVGLTTRSSLAALPALVEGARSRLRLPDPVVGFGLPLAASMFKPNTLVSGPGRVLFLAWVLDLAIDPLSYVLFVGYAMLLAATTVGIPSQSGRVSLLPAYLALGIPIEAVMLLESVDVIWDFAATVLNATGYLATTTLLPRVGASASAPEPAG